MSDRNREKNSLSYKQDILEYWTQVEFFTPYQPDIFKFYKKEQGVYKNKPVILPWCQQAPLKKDDDQCPRRLGYNLYLGLFSIKEIADHARHFFKAKPTMWRTIDWDESCSPSNLSCFARITLTQFGEPQLNTLSLSTLPWAHGHLLKGKASLLSYEAYKKSTHQLGHEIEQKLMNSLPKKLVKEPDEFCRTLDFNSLLRLVHILFQWANFSPRYYPIALIEPLNKQRAANSGSLDQSLPQQIPILNSFYIEELERAKGSLSTQANKALDLYLSGKHPHKIDLSGEEGKSAILKALRPSHFPEGRWPSPIHHNQSLMQQFSINQALISLRDGGLFSINGPPGTGKTTLLRDIIAQNIVSRAEALVKFNRAQDAFTGVYRKVNFPGTTGVRVNELHPSLLGYEMVVVSSNNTAVDNLSKELPLRQSIDAVFSQASYMEFFANKLLHSQSNDAWGLVSVSLGKKENCRQVIEHLFTPLKQADSVSSIWDWGKHYKGPTFEEAKQNFLTIQCNMQRVRRELDYLADLHNEWGDSQYEATLSKHLAVLDDIEERAHLAESEGVQLEKNLQLVGVRLEGLMSRRELLKEQKPKFLDRLLARPSSLRWREEKKACLKKSEALNKEKAELLQQKIEIETMCDRLWTEFDQRLFKTLEWIVWAEFQRDSYIALKSQYPDVTLLSEATDLNHPDVQKGGQFQSERVNHLRSLYFLSALTVHEAWVAEVSKNQGGFRSNLLALKHLIEGSNPTIDVDLVTAWKNMFLLIPVISSTFASIRRLFRYLGPQSIGWVFIDEAGQALPQAAVGVLWRAQKVISIGDPLQIEPISTVPPEVTDGMAKRFLSDSTLQFSPSLVSVQNLMDDASKLGITRRVGETTLTLGIPLRVHRRCLEPMFSLANEIAYENQMVQATKTDAQYSLTESCWIHVEGNVTEQQYVPMQGKELVKRLSDTLIRLPAPDVYIVSPFREVVRQIKFLLKESKSIRDLFGIQFPYVNYQHWINQSIGTVHTFQGKESDVVFFVLGADATKKPAIAWASQKPNLLNVAVTRARYRFYVIGDYDLWSQAPYFDVASKKLLKVNANDTLRSDEVSEVPSYTSGAFV